MGHLWMNSQVFLSGLFIGNYFGISAKIYTYFSQMSVNFRKLTTLGFVRHMSQVSFGCVKILTSCLAEFHWNSSSIMNYTMLVFLRGHVEMRVRMCWNIRIYSSSSVVQVVRFFLFLVFRQWLLLPSLWIFQRKGLRGEKIKSLRENV